MASSVFARFRKIILGSSRLSVNEILSLPLPEGVRSPLESLPQELLVIVVAYLPLESQACLAISNRTMAKKLGTQYWRDLRREHNKSSGILQNYLQLLLHDQPSMYYCYNCIQLCSLDGRDHRCSAPGTTAELLDLGYNNCYHLSFQAIQLAMARHRYYGSTKTYLERLHFTCGRPPYSILPVRVSEPEARCVSGHLLFRTQNLIPFDLSSPHASSYALCFLSKTFCGHNSRVWSLLNRDQIKVILTCVHDHSLPEDCKVCDFRPLCQGCPTEMSVQKVQTGKTRYMVIVTKWKDLGVVSTPKDPIWQAHLSSSGRYGLEELNDWKWTNPQWQLAKIRHRFETQPGVTAAELTQDNLRKWDSLEGKVERFLYQPSGLGMWEPLYKWFSWCFEESRELSDSSKWAKLWEVVA